MKRIISLALALALLCLAFASCGAREKVDISDKGSISALSGSGAVLAAQKGTFHLTALQQQITGVTAKEYPDFPALLTALRSGAIDGYVAEEPTAFTETAKDPDLAYLPLKNNDTGFRVVGDETGIAVAFKKGSELLEKVNAVLAGISQEKQQELMNQIFDANKNPETELHLSYAVRSDKTDVSKGVLKISMECAYDPFNWTQTSVANGAVPISGAPGQYANGYDVQIAKYIAAELGMSLEIVRNEWDSLIPAVTSGAVDCVIAGMSPTDERKQEADFSDCYYRSNLVIIYKK